MATVEASIVVEPVERSYVPARGSSRKKLIRRKKPDRIQKIRRGVQWAFLALNVWIGAQFYLWVRYFERGGHAVYVSRPPGVEGWLPIAGLMNLKYFLATGDVPSIHPAAMFLLVAFLAISMLMKKAFCTWLCPIGTVSEKLWLLGRKLFGRNLRLPRWLDIPLRGLKYLLLGFFVYIVGSMSAVVLDGFMHDRFALLADVKMLKFFVDMSVTTAIVLAVLVVLSVLIQNFWCRYLCPYGALMGLVSMLSPVKIRRDAEACIDCGKCARACPSHLPVDQLVQIRSAECASCMECVTSCPAENALQLALAPAKSADVATRWKGRVVGPVALAAVLAVLFLGTVAIAKVSGHWQTHVPRAVYMNLVPNANELTH